MTKLPAPRLHAQALIQHYGKLRAERVASSIALEQSGNQRGLHYNAVAEIIRSKKGQEQ